MDVLRHTARAQLSSFIGGSPGNRAMDRTQWAIAPYTEDDLQKQIDLAPAVYGDRGRELVERGNAFVDGINAYIDKALSDPTPSCRPSTRRSARRRRSGRCAT